MTEVSDETKAMARESEAIVDQIAPLLVGHRSTLQGNVIAMLLGMWLAGHHIVPQKGASEEERIKGERALRARLMIATTNAAFAYAADLDKTRDEKEKRQ